MRITGTIPKEDLIFVPVEFKIDKFKLEGSADFLIDTGSTTSFINESVVRKIKLDYSQLLYVGNSTGVGGEAEMYEIEGFTRLFFEAGNERKECPRKNFRAMKHNFCEHIPLDVQGKVLALEGILGMDVIKGWRLAIAGSNYTLEV